MNKINFEIKLLSDTILASGGSGASSVDKTITTDQYGLPIIPGKRLKGLLLESSLELLEATVLGLDSGSKDIANKLDNLYGKVSNPNTVSAIFGDAYPENYQNIKNWLKWLLADTNSNNGPKIQGYFSKENIKSNYIYTRRMTSINQKGVAEEHSLRTFEVIKKGLTFTGNIKLKNREFTDKEKNILILSFNNMRHIGTNRNRGYGKVKAALFDDSQNPVKTQYSIFN